MLKRIYGRLARFCNGGCAEGFKCDRQRGLIYTAFKFPTGKLVNPEPASVIGNHCCYCNAEVKGDIPESHRQLYTEAYGEAPDATPKEEKHAETIC